MALSLSGLTVNTFQQTLGALSKILDKAAAHCEAKKIDQAVLLGLRLAPDMLPFVKQVQLTCDFAKNCVGRLTGEPQKFLDKLIVSSLIEARSCERFQLLSEHVADAVLLTQIREQPGPLAGEPPKFPDDEKTIAELKARIAKTLDYVNGFKAADIDAADSKDVTFPIGPQKTMTLKGDAFVIHFVLPNFYFHATTAYDILRHNGLEIGKMDFIGRA